MSRLSRKAGGADSHGPCWSDIGWGTVMVVSCCAEKRSLAIRWRKSGLWLHGCSKKQSLAMRGFWLFCKTAGQRGEVVERLEGCSQLGQNGAISCSQTRPFCSEFASFRAGCSVRATLAAPILAFSPRTTPAPPRRGLAHDARRARVSRPHVHPVRQHAFPVRARHARGRVEVVRAIGVGLCENVIEKRFCT